MTVEMTFIADAPDTLEILDTMSGNKIGVGDKDVLLFVDQHVNDDRIQNISNNNRERNRKENILSLCSRKSPSHFYILLAVKPVKNGGYSLQTFYYV